jgi:hypothetical protein
MVSRILPQTNPENIEAQLNQPEQIAHLSNEIRRGPKKHDYKQETYPDDVVPLLQLPGLVLR